MKNLFHLLERFSRSLNKDTLFKETIAQTIFERTNIKINPENLAFKEGVLELEGSPAVNNEIKLKEASIREELKERYQINVTRILYK